METQNQITAWHCDSHSHREGWAGDELLVKPKPACPGRFAVEGTSEALSLSFSAHLPNSPCWGRGQPEVRMKPCVVALPWAGCVGLAGWSWLCWAASQYHSGGLRFPFLVRRNLTQALGGFWCLQGFLPPSRKQRVTDWLHISCLIYLQGYWACLHNCDDCRCLLSFELLGHRYIYLLPMQG